MKRKTTVREKEIGEPEEKETKSETSKKRRTHKVRKANLG